MKKVSDLVQLSKRRAVLPDYTLVRMRPAGGAKAQGSDYYDKEWNYPKSNNKK